MKLNAILASIMAVLLISSFFVSRQAAIIRANNLMTPAIENGWSNFETSLFIPPGGGPVPVWWVRYELKNDYSHPLAVYVDFRGKVDDWEVREMLDHYNAEQNAAGQPATRLESK